MLNIFFNRCGLSSTYHLVPLKLLQYNTRLTRQCDSIMLIHDSFDTGVFSQMLQPSTICLILRATRHLHARCCLFWTRILGRSPQSRKHINCQKNGQVAFWRRCHRRNSINGPSYSWSLKFVEGVKLPADYKLVIFWKKWFMISTSATFGLVNIWFRFSKFLSESDRKRWEFVSSNFAEEPVKSLPKRRWCWIKSVMSTSWKKMTRKGLNYWSLMNCTISLRKKCFRV